MCGGPYRTPIVHGGDGSPMGVCRVCNTGAGAPLGAYGGSWQGAYGGSWQHVEGSMGEHDGHVGEHDGHVGDRGSAQGAHVCVCAQGGTTCVCVCAEGGTTCVCAQGGASGERSGMRGSDITGVCTRDMGSGARVRGRIRTTCRGAAGGSGSGHSRRTGVGHIEHMPDKAGRWGSRQVCT